MQSWQPTHLGEAAIAPGHELVDDGLQHWLGLPPGRVHGAWGTAPPTADATVSGSTRLVLALDGRNVMRFPIGTAVSEQTLCAGDAVVVDQRAWNQPLHRAAKRFLTIDLRPDFTRFYLRRTYGPGSEPAEHCRSLVQRPASRPLRLAGDAAEALVREPGEALSAAARLLVQTARRELDLVVEAGDPTWQRLHDWLEDHLHENIGRIQAAAAIGVHPAHISRICRRGAGIGLATWLTRRRIERAQALLGDPGLSVADVARRCGFCGPEWFATTFRRHVGSSPARWRHRVAG